MDLFLDIISFFTILLLGPCWPNLRILLFSLPIRSYFRKCQLLLMVLRTLSWKSTKFKLLLIWFTVNRSISIMDLFLRNNGKHLLLHRIIDSNRCCIWKFGYLLCLIQRIHAWFLIHILQYLLSVVIASLFLELLLDCSLIIKTFGFDHGYFDSLL